MLRKIVEWLVCPHHSLQITASTALRGDLALPHIAEIGVMICCHNCGKCWEKKLAFGSPYVHIGVNVKGLNESYRLTEKRRAEYEKALDDIHKLLTPTEPFYSWQRVYQNVKRLKENMELILHNAHSIRSYLLSIGLLCEPPKQAPAAQEVKRGA